MMLSGIKKFLMLFMIPIWIPMVIIYTVLSFLIILPYRFITYYIYGFYRYGSLSNYLDKNHRLEILVRAKLRATRHEHLSDFNKSSYGVKVINCFLVYKGDQVILLIPVPFLLKIKWDHERAYYTEIYRTGHTGKNKIQQRHQRDVEYELYCKYLLHERNIKVDCGYFVTYNSVKIKPDITNMIRCKDIKEILEDKEVTL